MSQHQIRRIGWIAMAVAVAMLCGGALWQLARAQQIRLQSPAAEPVAHLSSQPQQLTGVLPPYDLAAINADPDYYNRADASRLNLRAPLAAGQQRQEELLIVGDPFRIVLPYSSIDRPLIVRAKPGRPVTFTAPDSGTFANGENTITVKADEQGLAATTFSVGIEGGYRVLASSPENAGTVRFIIQCVTKEIRDELESGQYAQRYLARQRAAEEQRSRAAAEVKERIQRKRSGR